MTEEKPKEWEQPWSPEKIRLQSSGWSLAGDAGLLLYLRETSENLCGRFDGTKRHMGELSDEAKKTAIRLENAVSDFARLANNQFMENRVYEDDTRINRGSKSEQEKPKAKEEREAQLVSTMKLALETGCAVQDSHFTKVDVRSLDFDEDDDPSFNPQPIFEPRDPYGFRPLPHVIATADFVRSEFIGLQEDEDEMQAKKKTETLSDSDDEQVVPVVIAERPAVQQLSVSAAKSIGVGGGGSAEDKTASDSSSSGLFGTSADSTDNIFPHHPSSSQRASKVQNPDEAASYQGADFRAELAKKMDLSKKPEIINANSSSKEGQKQSTEPASTAASNFRIGINAGDNLFITPPPLLPRQQNLEDSDEEGGLFGHRPRGLFDDDEDEEDKVNSLPRGRLEKLATPASNVPVSKHSDEAYVRSIPTPAKSNVGAPVRESSVPAEPSPSTAKSPAISTAAQGKAISMFANDDEDDEDDLFGKAYKREIPAPPKIVQASAQSSAGQLDKKPAILAPPAANVFSGGGAGLFGDEDEDDDLFDILKRPKEPVPKSQGVTATPKSIAEPISFVAAPSIPDHHQRLSTDASVVSGPEQPVPSEKSKSTVGSIPDAVVSSSILPSTDGVDVVQKDTRPAAVSLFDGDSDDDLFTKDQTDSKKTSGSLIVEKKNNFRNELAKKLMTGPKSSGLVKPTPKEESVDGGEYDENQGSSAATKAREQVDGVLNGFKSTQRKVDEDINRVEQAVTFDDTTNAVETLPTLQKNRAQLPQRRPPTKKAQNISSDHDDLGKRPTQASSLSPSGSTGQANNQDNLGVSDPLTGDANIGTISPSKIIQTATKSEPSNDAIPASSLFDDDDDDLFGSIAKAPVEPKPKKEEKVEVKRQAASSSTTSKLESKKVLPDSSKAASSLFSDDDEEDLFSNLKRPLHAAKDPAKPIIDSDIFASESTAKTKSVAPPPQPQIKKKQNLFDDDEDDVDIFR